MTITTSSGLTGFPGVTGFSGVSGASGIAASPGGATAPSAFINIDFTTGLAFSNGFPVPSPARYTSQVTNAHYFNSAGVLSPFPASLQVPVAYDPLSLEPIGAPAIVRQQNIVINSRAEGAVAGTPGTMPTGWGNTTPTGATSTVVGTGTEDGIPYVDVRWQGTPTAGGCAVHAMQPLVAITQGKTYSGAMFIRLISGGFGPTTVAPRVSLYFFNVGNALLNQASIGTIPTTAPLRMQRKSLSLDASVAGTVSARFIFDFTPTAGTAIDVTLRFGLPTLSEGSVPSKFPSMPTAGNAIAVNGPRSDIAIPFPAARKKYSVSAIAFVGPYSTSGQSGGLKIMEVGQSGSSGTMMVVSVNGTSYRAEDNASPGTFASVAIPATDLSVGGGFSFAGTNERFNVAAGSVSALSNNAATIPNIDVSHVGLGVVAVTAGQAAAEMGVQSYYGVKVYGSTLTSAQLLSQIAFGLSGPSHVTAFSPTLKRNHFIAYGQSLSAAAEGTPIITAVANEGTFAYGSTIRPITNSTVTSVWDRNGADAFSPMVTTGDAEMFSAGAMRLFRSMTMSLRGLTSEGDTNTTFVTSGAGIGGVGIAALSKGAPENIYNRYISCMTQAKAKATASSETYGIGGILWVQGESNQTTAPDSYQASMNTLINDMLADAIAMTGQAVPPHFFTYQTACNPNFAATRGGPSQAQLNIALTDSRVTMIGPVYCYPDSANLHLVANPYRWFGAQFAKVMNKVINLRQDFRPLHMLSAVNFGGSITLTFHVPEPPLVFEDSWLQAGFNGAYGQAPLAGTNSRYTSPNKGFVLRNSITNAIIPLASVSLLGVDKVALVPTVAQPVSTPLIVSYADGSNNADGLGLGNNNYGHGSLRDSDPTVSVDIWTQVAGASAADTNPTLNNLPYPLYNWAVAQFLIVS